jgi:HAD superfamily hydrolase (TIGR01549 family)
MGGDQLVPSLAGQEVDKRCGDEIRSDQGDIYMKEFIDEVSVAESARELLLDLDDLGHQIVLASSARQREVDHYLDLLDARDIVDGWTSSGDVSSTKPAPDLVEFALEKADATEGVMIGDSPYDCESAGRAGIATIGVLTGCFSEQELLDAGAVRVYNSLTGIRNKLDQTPLG